MNNYNIIFSHLSNNNLNNLINNIFDPSNITQNYRNILLFNIDNSLNYNIFLGYQ